MKKNYTNLLKKIAKITGLTIASILLLLFLLPILFPGTVGDKVKEFARDRLNGEMNFSKVRLSFYKHFPSFTVSLYDFSLKGSAPFQKDTLLAAEEIAFGINLKTVLFDKQIKIDKIFISDAHINVQVDEKGAANYNVYTPKTPAKEKTGDTAGTSLKLEKIKISNSTLIYNDRSIGLLIDAKNLNYIGSGDLSKAIFDLSSKASIESFGLSFAGKHYLENTKVNGELITKINTNSLAFIFEKNELHLNKLPVELSGKLDFLKNGYNLDFKMVSTNSELNDFVTALPPQFRDWQQHAKIKGNTDLLVTLKGQYVAATNSMPDLAFNMKIRDGYVSYEDAAFPASNIYLNLDTKLPALNTDSLLVKVDSIFFNVEKDYLSAVVETRGLNKAFISAKMNATLDLEKLDKAIGITPVDFKGKLDLHFTANGLYASGPNPNSLRHEEVLLSIPAFTLQSSLKNGYIKYSSVPQAIDHISFDVKATCADNDYKNTRIGISHLNATALNNYIKGDLSLNGLKNMEVDADIQSSINLADIKSVYPLEGLEVKGALKIELKSKGTYDGTHKKFPLTTAAVQLTDGYIKTAYYPNPLTDIAVKLNAADADGNLRSLKMDIQPAAFQFEGKPFQVTASLQNFDNIAYAIKADGELDLAKIYRVFSRKGVDVSGFIKASLSMSGRQNELMQQQYGKLKNEGTLELKEIKTTSDLFPQPFIIKYGLFSFNQDKMWFKNFTASYGQSDFKLDGYLQNVINYALTKNAILKGNFKLDSKFLNVDEFMAFSGNPAAVTADPSKAGSNPVSETGVIIIPSNLDIQLDAAVGKAAFNGINIEEGKGTVLINNGTLTLQQVGFGLIGCKVAMDAQYASVTPLKAMFDYHIKANDFDIHRAYQEVKIFRDMATAAGSAEGIISLDYQIKGRLDSNMKPVYPSLSGGGVLSVKNVKMKGFKLLTAVSHSTGKDSIASPDLSKFDIKTTIKNNLLTIEKFKVKMAGFRLRTEGQTSLDGKLNLKMRLGLPPLGIVGIPLIVTGTQDKPSIKMGKSKDELNETEDKDQNQ